MRICLFTPTFLPRVGGAERDADILARGLLARGHGVLVLAQSMGPVPRGLPYEVRTYRRPPAQNLWPEALGWPLARAHRAFPFDACLAFYAYPTGYAAARLKRRLGFGLVTTPRGADLYPQFHMLGRPRVAGIIRDGYRRADRIVSISGWITQRLREVAGPASELPPIDLVYNGIDLAAYDAERDAARAAPPALGVKELFILHLARVAPVKRQDLAVEAVHLLRDEFTRRGLSYVIVGDGNGMDDLLAQVARLNLGGIVKVLGSRVGMEKAWLLDHAEFMVSTSREEAFGNVVLEAMAGGLPMLASDIGSHRELIGRRGWGALFKDSDADDLAAKLRWMLDADRQAMRRVALREREAFTLDAMIGGYEASLRRALGDR